jgi:hypothetical protein
MVTSVRRSFVGRLESLRQALMLEQDSQRKPKPPRAVAEAGTDLSKGQRRQADELVTRFMQDTRETIEVGLQAAGDETSVPTLLTPVGGEMAALAAFALLHPDAEESSDNLTRFLDGLAELGDGAPGYALAVLDWKAGLLAPSALARSAFVGAITEFEVLLSSLLRIGAFRHPKALGVLDRRFTVAEYESTGGEPLLIRLAAAHTAVEELMSQSPAGWFTAILRWPGVDVAQLVPALPDALELFARRNVLVHADGVVDAKYREATKRDVPIGSRLDPTTHHTIAAIDLLLGLGEGLALLWTPKIEPSRSLDFEAATSAVYRQVERRRWPLTRTLASRFLREPVPDGQDPPRAMEINRWLAIREEAGTIDAIEQEVAEWDYPTGDGEWPLAVAALLGDVPNLVRLIDEASSRGERLTHPRRWPLMQLMAERHEEVKLRLNRPARPRPRQNRRNG